MEHTSKIPPQPAGLASKDAGPCPEESHRSAPFATPPRAALAVALVACARYAPGDPAPEAGGASCDVPGQNGRADSASSHGRRTLPEFPGAYASEPATAAHRETEETGPALAEAVNTAFTLCGYAPTRGERVLVKPNLLRADALTCTHPLVVREVCAWLLERGVRVTVGDSPGFGTAPGVARSIGLCAALEHLPGGKHLMPQSLGKPVRRQVPGLGPIAVARQALEADSILSLPRIKAHSQMRLTCAVKNLFGCVSGVHKALAHARHGDRGAGANDLARYIAALVTVLPPQAALVDGILTMHVTGPTFGQPCRLGLLAASTSCVAVDTAIYSLLGLTPEELPLWRALRENDLFGAKREDILLTGSPAHSFPTAHFQLPAQCKAHSFSPARLVASTLRRLWAGFTK